MKKTTLAIFVIATITSLLTGCNNQAVDISDTPTTEETSETTPAETPETTPATTLEEINQEGTKVYYEGTITVSGEYREYQPDTLLGATLCFYPDGETSYLVPRSAEDTRLAWFCFDNQDEAKELFEINETEAFGDSTVECIEGLATIEVSNYTVDLLEAAVFDTASLDNIVSKEPYATTCNN